MNELYIHPAIRGRIAGWTEYVQPVREKSLFWHGVWLQCGRPWTGGVADCMRRTHAAYHYAIRKVKRDDIINERLADSILNNSTRDFWSEIKRIRSNGSGTSRIVDGQTESISIAKHSLLISSSSYITACRTTFMKCGVFMRR